MKEKKRKIWPTGHGMRGYACAPKFLPWARRKLPKKERVSPDDDKRWIGDETPDGRMDLRVYLKPYRGNNDENHQNGCERHMHT